MIGRFLACSAIALMLVGCVTSPSVAPSPAAPAVAPSGPVPAEYLPAIRRAERLGGLIYQKDRAAALATDVLSARGVFASGVRLAGWITVPAPDGWLVRFIGTVAGTGSAGALYDVVVPAAGAARLAAQYDVPQALAPVERVMFRARATALASGFRPCSRNYNTVVLPADAPQGAWLVYLLAATAAPNEVVLGGHHRITVSPDGAEVLEATPLSKACLTSGTDLGGGRKLVEMGVTHILTPTPIETHVFLSLLRGLPLSVLTSTGTWTIVQGRVTWWSGQHALGSG